MSMVDKVAEAMSYADRMWEHSAIGNYEALARVAIEAMREPTDEQRNAYFALKRRFYPPAMAVFMDAEWERMIDAALMEPESPDPQEQRSDLPTPR